MINKGRLKYGVVALILIAPCMTSLAGVYDDAQAATDNYFYAVKQILPLEVSEQRRLVDALCSADEDERTSVARDAASRVRDQVGHAYDQLSDLKDKALDYWDKVLDDEQYKDEDKQDKIHEQQDKIRDSWERVDRMSESVRGSNNPVSAEVLRIGQEAHKEFQNNFQKCQISEFDVGSRRADCISIRNAPHCEVIELKPNNSRSISKGRTQAREVADALNKVDSEDRLNLNNKDSKFLKCEDFVPHVHCYNYCPEIDDQGNTKSTEMGWGQCD
jgi:hypothetical protein